MAKTTFKIPSRSGAITARNAREERLARHFLINVDVAKSIYADEVSEDSDEAYEALYRRAKEMSGMAEAMYWLGMVADADYYGDLSGEGMGIGLVFGIIEICKALAAQELEEAGNECA